MKIKLYLALAIFLLAGLFRFYKLSSYPVHLSMDETAIGYNAYSILKTGKDEWGEFMPLAFRSAGDYKPPVNVYLTVPSIQLFGLNEFAVRFPSALLGSLTPLIAFFLLLEFGVALLPAFLAAAWLSILPWHIHFSRASFEAITALFFVFLGVFLFKRAVNRNKFFLFLLSLISFSLSVWAYHSQRLFVPLLCLVLLPLHFNYLKKLSLKQILISIATLLIFALPFLKLSFFTPAVSTRALSTSILRETSLNQQLHQGSYQNLAERILDNDVFIIIKHWLAKYLNYFDLNFWFVKGMQFTPPGFQDLGLFYLTDALLIFLGLLFFLQTNKNWGLSFFLTALFLLGPLAASFTMNEQHPLRALTWLPFFVFIVAYGFQYLLTNFRKLQPAVFAVFAALSLINSFYFIDIYTKQFPVFFSEYWQYGFKEIAQYSCSHLNEYDKIIISDTFGTYGPLNTGLPYLYVAFFCQYDPAIFQKNNRQIEKFAFNRLHWKYDNVLKNTLLIGSPWEFFDDPVPEKHIIKTINFMNNKPGFYIIKTTLDEQKN